MSSKAPALVSFTPLELRASLALAGVYGLRMLGLFLMLPVLALGIRDLPGGDDAGMAGLALGMYGLTQAMLQIPYGLASDRWGRRPIIMFGLLLFAGGSLLCALAPSVELLVLGRALQGGGAVSAAVSAYLADLTRDEVRTRAMAIVGASIGLSFALSLVLAPPLYGVVGLSGLFLLTAALALAATWTVWRMPNPAFTREALLGEQRSWMSLLRDSQLQSLNLGVFVMMSIQTAMFVAIPIGLDHLGMGLSEHWKVYLPLLLLAFVAMAPFILWAERAGRNKPLFMASIAVLFGSMLMFWFIPAAEDHLWSWLSALWVFMLGFNLLEALLPSWVSRVAPPAQRGQALGIYNTSQSLGLFAGGLAGGLVAKNFGSEAIFLACAIVILLWALASARLKEVSTRHEAQAA